VSTEEERLDEDHCEENQGCSQDDVLLARSRCLKIPRSDMNKMAVQTDPDNKMHGKPVSSQNRSLMTAMEVIV